MTTPPQPPPASGDVGRAGFTFIEMMVVAVIVSILAGLAIPNYRAMVTKARAADILGDVDVVKVAAASHLGDRHSWPADAAQGTVPTALEPYLPDNFSFVGDDYEIDWENGGGLVGVGIVTDNQQLGNLLVDLVGSGPWFVSGNRYVFVLEPS